MYIMFCRNEFRKTQSHHHGLTHSPHIWRTIISNRTRLKFCDCTNCDAVREQTSCLPSSRSHTEIPQCCILRCIRASGYTDHPTRNFATLGPFLMFLHKEVSHSL